MKPTKKKSRDELRMSSAEFDRIMGLALQVKPESVKTKPAKKAAKKRAKRS